MSTIYVTKDLQAFDPSGPNASDVVWLCVVSSNAWAAGVCKIINVAFRDGCLVPESLARVLPHHCPPKTLDALRRIASNWYGFSRKHPP